MSFDKATRNVLAKLVAECRRLLTADIRDQLQRNYGLQPDGTALPIPNLQHLDEPGFEIARELRTWQDHLASTEHGTEQKRRIAAFDRLVQETAFTTLNRLAALRLCEERAHIRECVRRGKESDAFALYEQLSGGALGSRGETYRQFLQHVVDELAQDLGVLFDRRQPQSLVFPGELCLEEVLALLNDPALRHLWQEDETIGWIYQYYNSQEERRRMREESAAPRNSHELAVRNQFFTPRYVVEFLTDNTLGRIWYEMTKGATSLKDRCRYLVRRPSEIFLGPGEDPPANVQQEEMPSKSQEELLKEPAYIPHRPLKDPREIRLLDPACGSMHFGLYAFDLFEAMYEEAWDNHPDLLADLREAITDKREFLILVPKLIIEHNLHGIEIDPRCTQIAGLSLWLRAQKTWQLLGLRLADRPRIAKSNIVCAEPMPGEKELLREFTTRLESRAIGQLVEMVFDKMELAGEAGSLLKIEEEIKTVVADAKALWKQGPKYEQSKLFVDLPAKPEQQEFKLDLTGISDEQFWERAEELIYTALRQYAEQTQNGGGYRRRLFVQDAACGFALIDVCRNRYDVVLMNPPFGEAARRSKPYLEENFPCSKNDVYAAFVERGIGFLTSKGRVGVISSRTGFFLSSLQAWRENILLPKAPPAVVADLGSGVLDSAMVETAAYCLEQNEDLNGYGITSHSIFLRLMGYEHKAEALAEILKTILAGDKSVDIYLVRPASFGHVPGSPFSYWVTDNIRDLFKRFPPFEGASSGVKVGLQTGNDFRFLRAWWEVPTQCLLDGQNAPNWRHGIPQFQEWCRHRTYEGRRWLAFAKGGEYLPFHPDLHLVMDWAHDGRLIKESKAEDLREGRITANNSKCWNEAQYFLPGLTWPKVTISGLSMRPLPGGTIFSVGGLAAFPLPEYLEYWLAFSNTQLAEILMRLMGAWHNWEAGMMKRLPMATPPQTELMRIRELVAQAITCAELSQSNEVTWRDSQWVLHLHAESLVQLRDSIFLRGSESFKQLQSIIQALESVVNGIYEVTGEDAKEIERFLKSEARFEWKYDEITVAEVVTSVISYSIGCVFGRWDIRFATEKRSLPEVSEPFAPLPECPPGMLQNEHGIPASSSDVPDTYPLRISWPGILVDDANRPDDIERRIREVLAIIWKERTEAIEYEACQILGVRSLREYFSKPSGFFTDHLKRYSKSRRQAPIYWPLSTRSGSYTIWVYYCRLNDDVLYKILNEYVTPKIYEVEKQIAQVETNLQGATGNKATKLREAFEETKSFLAELQDFKAELLRVAELPYKPNLNDGVLITAAPLWKLFRLPKWRKDLKECWEQLEAGDFDWAHLAYSIWPDRVREKCKTDRSLAIAHGLEQLCETRSPGATLGARRKRKAKAAAPAES